MNIDRKELVDALVEAVKEGRIKKGEKMLLDAFGGGLTWGAVVIEW